MHPASWVFFLLIGSVGVLGACGDDDGPSSVDGGTPAGCSEFPTLEGCPCLPGAVGTCYAADPATDGVGECRGGQTLCREGRWGECAGEVLPRAEACDGDDDDCDGVVDDGARSPCGGCDPTCVGGVWGEPDDPFVTDLAGGIDLTGEGWMTLAREERQSATVWVANSGDGTLSRIDAASARETARYATLGPEPSRVAVDWNGDAWVANRAFEAIASVTRVAGSLARCSDLDGDGTMETSSGPTDVLPAGEDECVTFHREIGGVGAVARALAIDGDRGLDGSSGGNVWIGMHDAEEVIVLDGLTLAERARVPTPGFQPYAATFDAWGTLWLLDRDGLLARIDRGASPLEAEILEAPLPCFLFYSLAVDDDGQVLLTGFSCDDAVRYDPVAERWDVIRTEASPRGIAWRAPHAWVSHTGGLLSRVGEGPLDVLDVFDLATAEAMPLESIGVGTDSLGNVWIASTSGGIGGQGLVTRVEAATGRVTAQVTVGSAPHTQGDLTGGELRGGFVPEGTASHVFTGCDGEEATRWGRLHVASLPGAFGAIEVAIRHAPDTATLVAQPFVVLGTIPTDSPPYPLALPEGGLLEVRLHLTTPHRDGAPRILRVGIEWACPGPG